MARYLSTSPRLSRMAGTAWWPVFAAAVGWMTVVTTSCDNARSPMPPGADETAEPEPTIVPSKELRAAVDAAYRTAVEDVEAALLYEQHTDALRSRVEPRLVGIEDAWVRIPAQQSLRATLEATEGTVGERSRAAAHAFFGAIATIVSSDDEAVLLRLSTQQAPEKLAGAVTLDDLAERSTVEMILKLVADMSAPTLDEPREEEEGGNDSDTIVDLWQRDLVPVPSVRYAYVVEGPTKEAVLERVPEPRSISAFERVATGIWLTSEGRGMFDLEPIVDPSVAKAAFVGIGEATPVETESGWALVYATKSSGGRDIRLWEVLNAEAREVAEAACSNGTSLSCFHLAVLHFSGMGTSADRDQASHFFEQACRHDSGEGCFRYGALLGHRGDKRQELQAYKSGCKLGHQASCKWSRDAKLRNLPSL